MTDDREFGLMIFDGDIWGTLIVQHHEFLIPIEDDLTVSSIAYPAGHVGNDISHLKISLFGSNGDSPLGA